jgi:hypothetical protein
MDSLLSPRLLQKLSFLGSISKHQLVNYLTLLEARNYAQGTLLLEGDQFCRWCGVIRGEALRPHTDTAQDLSGIPAERQEPALYVTTALARQGVVENSYHSVSAPLVNALAQSLSASNPLQFCTRLAKKAILILVMLPIWMLIVCSHRLALTQQLRPPQIVLGVTIRLRLAAAQRGSFVEHNSVAYRLEQDNWSPFST